MTRATQNYGLPKQQLKTNYRPLPIFITVMIFFTVGNWACSQLFAHIFHYQPVLGGFKHLYAPWAWWKWYSLYHLTYPRQFMAAMSFGVVATGTPLLIIALAITRNARKRNKIEDLYGSAHWATEQEIKNTSLLEGEGVYVGGWIDPQSKLRYLRHNGPEHVIAYAPTRSGKGVGLVLPTLLSWTESCVVLDIKGENYALTTAWRKHHANNVILRFDPTSATNSIRYNPLAEIRLGTEFEVGDAQNLGNIIVDPKGEGLKSHWDKTSFDLLTGLILHALYYLQAEGRTASLPTVSRMLSDPSRTISVLLNEMLTFPHVDGKPHYAVASSARDMLDKPEQEAGSVVSTAKSFLSLFKDPVVARNVSGSDFKIHDLMNSQKPYSLFLVINPADKGRLQPLIRTLITQLVRVLVEKMEFKDGRSVKHYKHRLLLLLDEFPSLGKLEIIEEALAYMAGYGLKSYLITQDKEQVVGAYGKDETITSNCHIKIAYAPNKPETADYLSKLCGEATVVKDSITVSGKRFGMLLGQLSTTYNETRRPLLTPDECMRLPGAIKDSKGDIVSAGDMLIICAGFAPIYGKQILYFLDKALMARARLGAVATDRPSGDSDTGDSGPINLDDDPSPNLGAGGVAYDIDGETSELTQTTNENEQVHDEIRPTKESTLGIDF